MKNFVLIGFDTNQNEPLDTNDILRTCHVPLHSLFLVLFVGFQDPPLQALSLLCEVSLLAKMPADTRQFRVSVFAVALTFLRRMVEFIF